MANSDHFSTNLFINAPEYVILSFDFLHSRSSFLSLAFFFLSIRVFVTHQFYCFVFTLFYFTLTLFYLILSYLILLLFYFQYIGQFTISQSVAQVNKLFYSCIIEQYQLISILFYYFLLFFIFLFF